MNISVIIPAYNAQATLVETLASVLGQTRSPDEIIVVDDGSTDATADIAAAASVRVIRQANSGPAIALNAGVAQATGDLLGFVDADDLWTNEKLALQSTMLEEQCEFDGVGGFVSEFLCPRNDPHDNARYRLLSLPEPSWLMGALLLRRQCFDRCAKLCSRFVRRVCDRLVRSRPRGWPYLWHGAGGGASSAHTPWEPEPPIASSRRRDGGSRPPRH